MKFFTILVACCFPAFALFAADDSRTILLEAKDAKIEGPDAKYDRGENLRCIRYWKSTNVVARWSANVPEKGAYRVLLTYACPSGFTGSEVEVTVGSQHANGSTQSTEKWSTFKEFDLGPVLLRKPGPLELSVQLKSIANKFGAWDLRQVKLMREE